MKQSVQHILLSVLLLANVLFTQVVVGYLHDHERVHEDREISIHTAEDSCFACSLDIVHELFYIGFSELSFDVQQPSSLFFEKVKSVFSVSIQASGRGPPHFSI